MKNKDSYNNNSILSILHRHSIHNPKNLAIVDKRISFTNQDLYKCIAYNHMRLRDNGIGPNARVALKTDSQIDFVISFFSLLSAGCTVVPLYNHMSTQEIEEVISIADAIQFDHSIIAYNPCKYTKKNLEDPCDYFSSASILHRTSGTTGVPKLCIRTLQHLYCEAQAYIETFTIGREDRILSLSPLYHSFALGAAVMVALISGACLYTIDQFQPHAAIDLIAQNHISYLLMVPIIAKALCTLHLEDSYDFRHLRIPLVGAGSISQDLHIQFQNRFGVGLCSNYGSTETGGLVSRINSVNQMTIGQPMPNVHIILLDEEGQQVLEGHEGEVCVKCPGMMNGYWDEQDSPFDEKGYFHMGDQAMIDQEGNVHLRGRLKHIIRVGSQSVHPIEVEQVIRKYEGVDDCFVCGVQKLSGEEAVKAYIEPNECYNETKLYAHCSQWLSSYKIPTVIEYVKELQKTETGKVISPR